MSAHVLLNLLIENELGKRDQMRGLFYFYLSYDIKITLKSHFCLKTLYFVIMYAMLLWMS